MEFDDLSNRVIGCALEVHRTLGPGLLESVYRRCMEQELASAAIGFEAEKPIEVWYKGKKLNCANLRVDFVVEGTLLLELKVVEKLLPVHEGQLLTYMKLSQCKTGLLVNFECRFMKDGIRRFVL